MLLEEDKAAECQQMAEAQAARDQRDTERRQRAHELRAEFIARLRGEDARGNQLGAVSNAVVDLVKSDEFDGARAAARVLLPRYPEVHHGWERLGMVLERCVEEFQAADCYR